MNNIADELEKRYPELLVLNSETNGVVYATAKGKKGIMLVTGQGLDGQTLSGVWLTEGQVRTIVKEIRELCALYTGRGRSSQTRERRKT